MIKLSKSLRLFKDRFFRFSDESRLNFPSKLIILVLDLFVLIILFSGLDDHTRQLTHPRDYLPYQVRQVLIEYEWSEINRLSKLEELVLDEYLRYNYQDSLERLNKKGKDQHQLVELFFQKIGVMSEDAELHSQFVKRSKLIQQKRSQNNQFVEDNNLHQTSLLSDIAVGQTPEQSEFNERRELAMEEMKQLSDDLAKLDSSILAHRSVRDFFEFVESKSYDDQRSALIKVLNHNERWYPTKEFFWQLLFLAPLFVVFYIWNSRSIRAEKHIHVLISTHILFIVLIPILIRVAEFLIELIPNYIFVELFTLLKGLKIIALWHYFLIALAVVFAAFMIVLIQKKILSQKRIRHKRVLSGNCYDCGKKLPLGSRACPSCGVVLYEDCPHCEQERLIGITHCNQCGKE